MNNKFQYCLLTYNHSQLLNEKLNVGVLFYFPNSCEIYFKHPKKLSRLKDLYNDFNESQLRNYLGFIEDRFHDINDRTLRNEFKFKESLDSLVSDVLSTDATTLQFSEIKTGKIFDEHNVVIEKFYELFFSVYEDESERRIRRDDEYIKRKVRNLISRKNQSVLHNLVKDVLIESPKTECKFEYQWKNGTTNLIKPLGLDLLDPIQINHKAIMLKGIFDYLVEIAAKRNYCYDVLITAPQNLNDNKIYNAFKIALSLLEDTKAPIRLKQEHEFEAYVDDIIKYTPKDSENDENNPF